MEWAITAVSSDEVSVPVRDIDLIGFEFLTLRGWSTELGTNSAFPAPRVTCVRVSVCARWCLRGLGWHLFSDGVGGLLYAAVFVFAYGDVEAFLEIAVVEWLF